MSLTLFPFEWLTRDRDLDGKNEHYSATMFARDTAGRSVAVHVRVPCVFLAHCPTADRGDLEMLISEMTARFRAIGGMCTVVERVDAWGFSGEKKKLFAQLVFPSKKRMMIAKAMVKKRDGWKSYGGSLDPLLNVFHGREVLPADWCELRGAKAVRPADAICRSVDLELECNFDQLHPVAEPVMEAPKLVVCSWDLECYSSTGGFPQGDVEGDKIIQCAASFRRLHEPEIYRRVVFCLGETVLPEGSDATVEWFDDEADMIHAFFDSIAAEKVDVLIGFNVQQFDWKYVVGRASILVDDATGEEKLDMRRLGRIDPDKDEAIAAGEPDEFELNSGAYGDNKFTSVKVPGVLEIDLLQWFKRETKHASYALNAMSKHYLGDNKIDLPAGQIFSKWASGIPTERGLVAEYAAKDTELPIRLLEKLSMFQNLSEMANATFVPINYILRRGQQIKVYSQLVKTGRRLGYVFPDDEAWALKHGEKFVGATVLEPIKGFHNDVVSGLDFASLYPSIIRAENLCPSTLVMNSKYDNLEGVDYYEIKTDIGTFRYAQNPKGILPTMLDDLALFRKQAKKDMAAAKARGDYFAAKLYDAKQLAYKVSMNSAYGFFGAGKGFLPCVPISASTTATGRNMIMKTKELAETLVPGSTVVYGDTDSVMVILNLGPEKRHDVHAHFEAASSLAAQISKVFRAPNELEFEKCYWPYALYSKKRYAGRMFASSPSKFDYIDVKGLALVRRDFAPIVKESSNAVLDILMHKQDAELAVQTARGYIEKVINEPPGCDMTPYIMSKTLRGSYKNTSQPHLFVANNMAKRTGESFPSGSRVPYVYCIRDDETVLGTKSGQAEHPDWARDHGMEIDRIYYIENQLLKPLSSMLEVVDPRIEDRLMRGEVTDRLDALKRGEKVVIKEQKRLKYVRDNKLQPITSFFKPVVKK
jgi:DNA polymerase delta subunit 1